MATEKVIGKLQRKAGNGKGFLVEGVDGWFNTSEAATPYLAKLEVGTEVEVDYFKKGIKKEVTKIVAVVAVMATPVVEAQKTEARAGFCCAVCGKAMKDDRFKVCFMCNKKGLKVSSETVATSEKETTSYTGSGSRYGSAEDVAGKEVGCSAGCAASILAGRQEQPEVLLEHFRVLMNGILEHIRFSK